MITNLRQFKIAKAQAEKFRLALDAPLPSDLHPKAAKAMREAAQSQLEEMQAEIAEFEDLNQGRVSVLIADRITGLGEALIKARIRRRLTQKELAERLSIAEQQVQRYEATLYNGVSTGRLQEIADALKLKVREEITFEES
ncbi:helix-turn-helix transcriptional regulator [Ferrovibrio sp.]|uniref:helix-turn-helix transcriptional regulator n=1 Tax=Ferrovibrio sp. TaxID=1917215 RepID=UPI0035AE905D